VERQIIRRAADRSPAAKDDLWAFSRQLVKRFVQVPAEALKRVLPDHMNLGLRYAWISSDLLYDTAPWFDVFSINCYAFEPGAAMVDAIRERTSKPVMIGEYHFGALDRGLAGTGLRGVASQAERGVAYRRFLESCAANPQIVGAHYFTLNDQSYLGRFDGENWNIGFVDTCQKAYPELAAAARASHDVMYAVRRGETPAFSQYAKPAAKIAL